MDLEPDRRVRSQARLFSVFRDMSNSFCRALRAGFGCSCPHQFGLELQTRSAPITPLDEDDAIMVTLPFQIAISYEFTTESDETSGERRVNWQGFAITTISSPPHPAHSPSTMAPKLAPTPAKTRTRKRFFFGVLKSAISASATSTATSTVTSLAPARVELELRTVTPNLTAGVALDLCQKLRQAQKQPASHAYGTLIDQLPKSTRR